MAEKENEKKKNNTAKKTTQNKKPAAKKPAAKKTTSTKPVNAKNNTSSNAKKHQPNKKATPAKKQQTKKPVAKQPVKKPEVKKEEVKKEEQLEKTIIFDGRQNKNLAEVVEKLEEKNVVLDDKVIKRSKGKKIAIIVLSVLIVAVIIGNIIYAINFYKQEKINNQTTTSNIYDKAKKNYKDVSDIKVDEEKKTTEDDVYSNIKTITVKEFEEKAYKKENMVVIVSSSTCYHCITYEPTVNKVFKSLNKTIYRIDVASTNQTEIDRFRTYYAFTVTPTIFVVKDGIVTADTTGSIDEENLTKWVNANI